MRAVLAKGTHLRHSPVKELVAISFHGPKRPAAVFPLEKGELAITIHNRQEQSASDKNSAIERRSHPPSLFSRYSSLPRQSGRRFTSNDLSSQPSSRLLALPANSP